MKQHNEATMTKFIRIKNGNYRNETIKNAIFPLVVGFKTGAKGGFVTVNGSKMFGDEFTKIRVKVGGIKDIEYVTADDASAEVVEHVETEDTDLEMAPIVESNESDEEVIERIKNRFAILDEMTVAAVSGDIRAMIVTGPPGVGKSYGVETELEKQALFDDIAGRKRKFEVIKGSVSAIGLFCTLYKFSDPGSVLVFDDCDSILFDDISLNLLKAALDSGKRRYINWNSDSNMLRREGVPERFEFKGSVIFITNLSFEHVRSKKLKDHLDALMSRCHYLDLTLYTMRDKFLRIKQIADSGALFADYNFSNAEANEVVDFMYENRGRLREMSLRVALKIADLRKISANNWKTLAMTTCCKNV